MNAHSRRLSRLRVACAAILIWLWLSLAAMPGRADVGVRPLLPGGGNLQPEEPTPVQMAAETVVMTARPATEADNAAISLDPELYGYPSRSAWFRAVAEVQAEFIMKNPTAETIHLTAWFPLACALEDIAWEEQIGEKAPHIAGFQLVVDGASVHYSVHELPNPQGEDKPALLWASFPVAFPAGQETRIQVSYVLPLHPLIGGNALALYYIFQTGAGWAGPIGRAELILNLPYPASPETLSGIPPGGLNPPYFTYFGDEVAGLPPGATLEGNQARWVWEDFEPGPQDDFSLLLLPPDRWEALQAARETARTSPEDGQAWLELCATYHRLVAQPYRGQIRPGWDPIYRQQGLQACREAARLLPGDAAPHYGLAIVYLAMLPPHPSAQALQPIQDELKIGQELEAARPPSKVEFYERRLDIGLAEFIADRLNQALSQAAAATEPPASQPAAQATPTTPPSGQPTRQPTGPLPATAAPTRATSPAPSNAPPFLPASEGGGQGAALGLAALAALLILAGALALRRR